MVHIRRCKLQRMLIFGNKIAIVIVAAREAVRWMRSISWFTSSRILEISHTAEHSCGTKGTGLATFQRWKHSGRKQAFKIPFCTSFGLKIPEYPTWITSQSRLLMALWAGMQYLEYSSHACRFVRWCTWRYYPSKSDSCLDVIDF